MHRGTHQRCIAESAAGFAMHSFAGFALLYCAPGSGVALACAPYIDTPEIAENFLKIFCGVLGCREVSEREKVVFRTLVEGCSEELFKDLRTLFACLRDKILEESEENLQKSE